MRNLGLIVALWLATLLPTSSFALGLGEIDVKSFLNQPLNAEIEVISARPGEIDDLLVSLATREAFTRAGLARPRYLSELRFAVQKNEEGDQATVLVTTKSAVKEPFLNFLIEADWSKGRVLREFTVLLDPPFYAEQPAPVESVIEPAAETDSSDVIMDLEESAASSVSNETAESSEAMAQPIAMSESADETQASGADYVSESAPSTVVGDIRVVKGDTLWNIASRFKDDDHSMAQVMLAIQRANPGAFNDGNINNLRVGAVLRAPGAGEIDALSKQESYAEVLVQNGLWDEYVARVSGVSPALAAQQSATGTDSAAKGSSGELSLLLPGDSDSESSGMGDSADVNELRTKLALAEEELEASRIENQELESRIGELQARLSKVEELQKIVEIEDDSLAQLQADADGAVGDTGASEPVTEAIKADEEALLEELLAEEAAAQAEEQSVVASASTDEMTADESTDQKSEESTAVADDQMMEDNAVVDSSAPPPAPVIVTEPKTRGPSIFDGILPPDIIAMIPSMPSMGGILGDPIILAAVGGVIVLLLVLVILKRRKSASDDDSAGMAAEDDLFAADDEDELTPIHLAEGSEPEETETRVASEEDLDASVSDLDESTDVAQDLAATAIISPVDMPEPEAPAAGVPEQDDVLNEVDVYLAYGLYDNAEELLNSSLTENPERADYRSKLLDTYFATKNSTAFVKEAEKLKSMGDAALGYWDRVQIMGYELAPENALFSDAKDSDLSAADLEISKPQEADFDLGAAEDETNFSTTDFNLGEEDSGSELGELTDFGDEDDVATAEQIQQSDELTELDDEDDTNLRIDAEAESETETETDLELPDDIGGELEFSMDEEASDSAPEIELSDDDDIEQSDELELPGEIELPDEIDLDDEPLDFGIEDATDLSVLPEDMKLDDIDDADMNDIALEFDVDSEEAAELEDISEIDFGAEFEAALEDADDLELDDEEVIPFEPEAEEQEPEEQEPEEQEPEEQEPEEQEPEEQEPEEQEPEEQEPEEQEIALDSGELEVDNAFELPESDEDPDELEAAPQTPDFEKTQIVSGSSDDSADDSVIDLGMEDTAMIQTNAAALATEELNLNTDVVDLPDIWTDEDDEEDISIIDFGGEDFDEPTDLVSGTDDDEGIRTGTFAPGDFEEPTAALESITDIDDIGDLMLPDDVDEVSTKLDLARAFIDMGDAEGARGSLEEVLSEGSEEQKSEAKSLLDQL